MSKEAALRAMREARYSERSADKVAPASATDQLCGHRSMSGRSCTREHGHAAKSHRYS
jgi:hypothetical protein